MAFDQLVSQEDTAVEGCYNKDFDHQNNQCQVGMVFDYHQEEMVDFYQYLKVLLLWMRLLAYSW